jgi:hypothetical protein
MSQMVRGAMSAKQKISSFASPTGQKFPWAQAWQHKTATPGGSAR